MAFLAIIGIEFYIYGSNTVLVGDEAAYCYVLDWEHNGWGLGYGIGNDRVRIETVSDIIASQKDHYMHQGGRSLVHTVEQFFSGVSSPSVFYVINTLVFLLTLILMVYLSVGKEKFKYPIPWLIVVIGFVYGLNWSLYTMTSINLACNYLWPMFGFVIVMAMWYDVRDDTNHKYGLIASLGMMLVSFIAGWSHEAYSLGLSGAFVLYYIFNRKEFRGAQAWIAIGYCLGALIMFLAPGNFQRLSRDGSKSIIFWILEFALALPRLKLVYVFLAILIYFKIKKKEYVRIFWKRYRILVYAWVFSLIFVCFMHTVSQSFTGIELMSLLLILSILRPVFKGKHTIICVCLMALVCIHVGFISANQFKQSETEKEAIKRYIHSEDGLAVNYTTECQNPFIAHWLRHPVDNFRRYPLTERLYANNPHPLILITPQDEQILKYPQKYFNEAYKFGSGPFYAIDGCSKVWAPVDSVLLKESYQWHFDKPKFYEQMSMRDRVLSIFNPGAVPKTMPTANPEIINTRYGDFMIIDIPTQRKIVGLSVKEDSVAFSK